jgi:YfiH family protein
VPGPKVLFTDRRDGDLAVGSVDVDRRRQDLVALPWTWLRQRHGARVLVVGAPGEHVGEEADAVVTAVAGAAIAVQVADCAPVALVAPEAVGVVHAGWRGLVAGVVPAAVAAMRGLGATDLRAMVGPCIQPGCYEFGATDLDTVAGELGEDVRGRTVDGRPALDLTAGVRLALVHAGVEDVYLDETCTACSPSLWSHRGAGDKERQAVVAWMEG